MNNNIKTILFDLDGTLLNTYELIIQSFMHTFDHYLPGHIKREDCIPFIGPPLSETFSSYFPDKTEEMIRYYREHNEKYHDKLVTEFPGVYETVKMLHEKGYKLGVVSTKVKSTINRGLDVSNLRSFFPVVIGVDDVEKAKPDPEPIAKALELLQSKSEEAIMVGDSHHDILAAKNAGTASVGVSWTIKGKDYLLDYQPDYLVDDMRELLKIVGAE